MLILLFKMQFCDLIYNEYYYKCHLFTLSGAKQHVYAWGWVPSHILLDMALQSLYSPLVPVQYSMDDSQLFVSLTHQKMILLIFI